MTYHTPEPETDAQVQEFLQRAKSMKKLPLTRCVTYGIPPLQRIRTRDEQIPAMIWLMREQKRWAEKGITLELLRNGGGRLALARPARPAPSTRR